MWYYMIVTFSNMKSLLSLGRMLAILNFQDFRIFPSDYSLTLFICQRGYDTFRGTIQVK
uniref:Uncharacterized protein n=1 Tax=Anguilla anguilla TaxID=7936 RepID=A0A0E9PK24_ANGAN